mmetsp:Transcript_30118/g.82310  ORF Transcript_30118/g.82310 Transcript_30118/m.82310 type:complete len:287 (+) Transcript_30118:1543-2403(+)
MYRRTRQTAAEKCLPHTWYPAVQLFFLQQGHAQDYALLPKQSEGLGCPRRQPALLFASLAFRQARRVCWFCSRLHASGGSVPHQDARLCHRSGQRFRAHGLHDCTTLRIRAPDCRPDWPRVYVHCYLRPSHGKTTGFACGLRAMNEAYDARVMASCPPRSDDYTLSLHALISQLGTLVDGVRSAEHPVPLDVSSSMLISLAHDCVLDASLYCSFLCSLPAPFYFSGPTCLYTLSHVIRRHDAYLSAMEATRYSVICRDGVRGHALARHILCVDVRKFRCSGPIKGG